MSSRVVFPPKGLGETLNLLFDFTSQLSSGETISAAEGTAAVYSGTDSSPSSLINGSATISGQQVTQSVTGGVEGVIYDVGMSITTSLGQILQMAGYVAVAPVLGNSL